MATVPQAGPDFGVGEGLGDIHGEEIGVLVEGVAAGDVVSDVLGCDIVGRPSGVAPFAAVADGDDTVTTNLDVLGGLGRNITVDEGAAAVAETDGGRDEGGRGGGEEGENSGDGDKKSDKGGKDLHVVF